jgi:pSer/pThr/pTyr-binding forkhead associated (FHA) protein
MTKTINSVVFVLIAALGSMFCFAQVAHAREWKLMLVPDNTQAHVDQAVEQGLSLTLGRSLEQVIDKQKAFQDCQQQWCGQASMQDMLLTVREKAPNVQLVLLYSFNEGALQVRLIDPLSFEVRLIERLSALGQDNTTDIVSLGQDMGLLISKRLDNLTPDLQYIIRFESFLFEELNGLPTFMLSDNANDNLSLSMSSRRFMLFDRYFAVYDSEYRLTTSLTASQLNDSLAQFFTQQNVQPSFEFSHSGEAGKQLIVKRLGNPYAPSLVTNVILFSLLVVLLIILLRRQYLDFYLREYAKTRQGDDWLETYQKARFVLYFLKKKWQGHEILWERLCRDSNDLANQAKMYFDASDVNTAKLFVSKALHTNANNGVAIELMDAIKRLESNSKVLSDNEQWIRNKIAKAMNNYRQNHPLKALKQLYQAHAMAAKSFSEKSIEGKSIEGKSAAGKEKSLKKQSKAIKKLIKQINQKFSTQVSAITINCSSDPTSLIVCQNQVVHIGRMPSKVDDTWISGQDSVHYINHRCVSRMGQQCYVQNIDTGFYIVDENSKNGTYLNELALQHNHVTALKHKDKLRIGGGEPLVSVNLKVSISDGRQLLKLRHNMAEYALLSRNDLNKVWPDNALSLMTELNVIKSTVKLCFDPINQLMLLQDVNDVKKSKKKAYVDLCLIRLGENAMIIPLQDANDFEIDTVPFAGEMPLILPCNIRYQDSQIQLSAYNNTSMRHSPISYLENDYPAKSLASSQS